MSIRLMTMVWDITFPTQSQLLIALKLADFANDEGGSIYPARSRLADQAQCSETTVKAVLRVFKSIGLLHVIEEGGKGPRDTTKYALNLRLLKSLQLGHCTIEGGSEAAEIKWAEKGAEFDPLDDLRGQPDLVRGQPTDAKGAASRPQSIINHQLDSSGARTGACEASATPVRALANGTLPPELRGGLAIRRGDEGWDEWCRWTAVHAPRARSLAELLGMFAVISPRPPPMNLTETSQRMQGGN